MANITLVLNDAEQQVFHQLLDTALRQSGLNALDVVSHFIGRISAALGTATQALTAGQNLVQVQPAAPVQSAAAVSPAQSHVSPSSQANMAAAQPSPVPATPVNGSAATHNPSGPAQHQSILSHLIGEITGAGQSQLATHSAASAAAPNSGAAPTAAAVQAPAAFAGTASAGTPSPAAASAPGATS